MKIYIAGPMRGIPLYNFPAFDAAAALLRALGHGVFNVVERERAQGFDPAKGASKTISDYMAEDLPEVCRAAGVAVLPGWESSQGAKIEVQVATALGKVVAPVTSSFWRERGDFYTPVVPVMPLVGGESSKSEDRTNPKDLLGLRKVPLRLVPAALLTYVSKVMALGATKYGPYNWREKKVRHTVYLEAAMRHLLQALDGEDKDVESGQPHEAHVAACMGILLDAKITGNLIEDRNRSGKLSALMSALEEKVDKTSSIN